MSGDDFKEALKAAMAPELASELYRSWGNGFQDGLQMAARMACAIFDAPETDESQRAVLSALISAYRSAQVRAGVSPIGGTTNE